MTEPDGARCITLCEGILATIEMIREAQAQIQEVSDRILARCDRILAKLERSEQKWQRRENRRRRQAARRQRQLDSTASTRATARCGGEANSDPSKQPGGQHRATARRLGAATVASRGALGHPPRR